MRIIYNCPLCMWSFFVLFCLLWIQRKWKGLTKCLYIKWLHKKNTINGFMLFFFHEGVKSTCNTLSLNHVPLGWPQCSGTCTLRSFSLDMLQLVGRSWCKFVQIRCTYFERTCNYWWHGIKWGGKHGKDIRKFQIF